MQQRVSPGEQLGRAYVTACLFTAFFAALIVVAGATQWFPSGAAGIDHIVLPALVFPLVWLAFVVGLLGARERRTAWGISALLVLSSAGAIAYGALGGGA